jgi:hypothetical protein
MGQTGSIQYNMSVVKRPISGTDLFDKGLGGYVPATVHWEPSLFGDICSQKGYGNETSPVWGAISADHGPCDSLS